MIRQIFFTHNNSTEDGFYHSRWGAVFQFVFVCFQQLFTLLECQYRFDVSLFRALCERCRIEFNTNFHLEPWSLKVYLLFTSTHVVFRSHARVLTHNFWVCRAKRVVFQLLLASCVRVCARAHSTIYSIYSIFKNQIKKFVLSSKRPLTHAPTTPRKKEV